MGIMVEVSADLDAQLAEALAAVQDQMEPYLDDLAESVAQEARSSTAFKDKTGKLRSSVKVVKEAGKTRYVWVRSPHAHLVEFGHVMAVKDKKAGAVRVVGHVSAKPFLRPALDIQLRLFMAGMGAGHA